MAFGALATVVQEYVAYGIKAHLEPPQNDPVDYTCTVAVVQPFKRSLQYRERIDRKYRDDASLNLPKSEDEFRRWFVARAVSRARAAIALDELPRLGGAAFSYSPERPVAASDKEVQFTILSALRTLRRLDPRHSGHVPLDAGGICLVRGISKGQFDYNRGRLEERGWVERFARGWDDNNYKMCITEKGLRALEEIEASRGGEVEGAAVQTGARPQTAVGSPKYFVAHEFSDAQTDDLREAINKAVGGSGLMPCYADVELRQDHVALDEILTKIRSARFGIYEASNPSKPNVFLELGAGLALGVPSIIICREGTQLPADIEGLDRIEYKSYLDLTRQLRERLKPYL
jgi:hypothetical protein